MIYLKKKIKKNNAHKYFYSLQKKLQHRHCQPRQVCMIFFSSFQFFIVGFLREDYVINEVCLIIPHLCFHHHRYKLCIVMQTYSRLLATVYYKTYFYQLSKSKFKRGTLFGHINVDKMLVKYEFCNLLIIVSIVLTFFQTT